MFMFVFAVVVIALVSLFFQIFLTLSAFLAGTQLGMGQQVLSWQAMAYDYICSLATPLTPPANVNANRIMEMRLQDPTQPFNAATNPSLYNGVRWNSVYFNGNYNGGPTRMLITYVNPAQLYGGIRGGIVIKQMRQLIGQSQSIGQVTTAGTVTVRVLDTHTTPSAMVTVTVTGLPTSGAAAVPAGSGVLLTIANCI
jgi:hypothetical protein